MLILIAEGNRGEPSSVNSRSARASQGYLVFEKKGVWGMLLKIDGVVNS